LLKQIRKAEKAEREFRKKFKVWTPKPSKSPGGLGPGEKAGCLH
jgi:hypothetical protein